MKPSYYLLVAAAFISFAPGNVALAADTAQPASQPASYTALSPLPCISGGSVTCPDGEGAIQNTVDFANYVQYAFNLLIFLSASAAVFMMIYGGLEYMTTSSFTSKSAGLEKVMNALKGLLLVLASYLILRTIDPRLVAIPTSLVPPVPVRDDSKDQLMVFVNRLDQYSSDLTSAQRQLAQSQSTARSQAADVVENSIQNLNDIMSALGDAQAKMNSTLKQLNDLGLANPPVDCLMPNINKDPATSQACNELFKERDDINSLNIMSRTETAKGVIAVDLQNCLSKEMSLAVVDDCTSKMDAVKNQYQTYNSNSGANDTTVSDLAEFAKAKVRILNELHDYNPKAFSLTIDVLSIMYPAGGAAASAVVSASSPVGILAPITKPIIKAIGDLVVGGISADRAASRIVDIPSQAKIVDPAMKGELVNFAAQVSSALKPPKK